MTRAVCGVDLGTSGVKVSLLDEQFAVLASATAGYPVSSPRPGWAEIDPNLWMRAIASAIGEVRGQRPDAEIVAVGLDGQMHGLVLVNAGQAVRLAMLWPDSRAVEVVQRWRRLPEELRSRLSNPIVPGMAGPMLAWLADNEPEAVARANRLCSPKDWVRAKLTGGEIVTDASDASATLLWDPSNHGWHTDLMAEVGLPVDLLPPLAESNESAGVVESAAAVELGLPSGIPVSVGCGDAAATLLAAAPAADETLLIVGTGIQAVQPDITALPDAKPTHHTFAGADGSYYGMVAPQNGGLALGRVRELLAADWAELYGSLEHPADPAVVFSPWFSSERLPRPKSAGQAGWTHLGLGTSRAQLLRAAVESLAFQAAQAVRSLPKPTRRLRLAGGGTRNPAFQQLLVDTLGLPAVRCTEEDATAIGACLLGWAALDGGRIPTSPVQVSEERSPNPDPGLASRFESFLVLSADAEDRANRD